MPLGQESIGTAFVRIIGDGSGLRDGINEDLDDLDSDFDAAGERHSKAYKKSFDRDMERDHGFFRRLANRFETLGEPLGRLLGRGSRNNFLNFFGSVVRNALFATGKIIDAFEAVGDAINSAFRGGSGAAVGLGGLTAAFGTAAASAFAFAAALAVAAVASSALISALLLLSGIVIALSGTIFTALIASVAAFLPLIIPMAAIILGVVAAIGEFKDANGKLGQSIDHVKDASKDLFEGFKDKAFKNAPALTQQIADHMKGLAPLANQAGRGFNLFATEMVKALTSPAISRFEDRFARFLPHAMESLGVIFGNVFQGFAGILTASIPLANQLLGWLEKITDNFAKWANSKKGQEDIKAFLERAAESAKSLGHFLGEAIGLITDLLLAGQGTGNSIFDSMANGLERVRNFLRDNPDALKNFFADARTFASTLGNSIERIAGAIDTIDSPTSRKAASWLIQTLTFLVESAALVIGAFESIGTFAVKVFIGVGLAITEVWKLMVKGVVVAVDGIIGLLAKIPGPAGSAARKIQGSFDNMADKIVGELDTVSVNIKGLEIQANNFNPTMDINTAPAVAKLNFLGQLAAQISAAIRNANATHIGPNAGEHGLGPSGSTGSTGSEGGAANGSRVGGRTSNNHITIITPTENPRAVATELLNRLAVVGY